MHSTRALESTLFSLSQQTESKKKKLPKGFHATLVKEFEDAREKAVRDSEREIVGRFRVEWEERLEKAGLRAEDWDPMTIAEQEAVRAALAGPSDDEEDEVVVDEDPVLAEFRATQQRIVSPFLVSLETVHPINIIIASSQNTHICLWCSRPHTEPFSPP